MLEKEVKTSSIGALWPPAEGSFNRIKALDNRQVIRSREQLLWSVKEFNDWHGLLDGKLDRISFRVFIDNSVLAQNARELPMAEAVIPLSGAGKDWDTTSLVYLGKNTPARQPHPNELGQCIKNVQDAMNEYEVTYGAIIKRITAQGYELRTISFAERIKDEAVRSQFVALYARFGWNQEDVYEILANGNNTFAVVIDEDRIVSAGIAETSNLLVGGHPFKMAELTEAATLEEYQGKGLYTAVAARLLKQLGDDEVNLAFGECNGNAPGVLKAAKHLGRTFSYEVSQVNEYPFRGFLPQHVPISGGTKLTTPYNDLFPSFITLSKMQQFART